MIFSIFLRLKYINIILLFFVSTTILFIFVFLLLLFLKLLLLKYIYRICAKIVFIFFILNFFQRFIQFLLLNIFIYSYFYF